MTPLSIACINHRIRTRAFEQFQVSRFDRVPSTSTLLSLPFELGHCNIVTVSCLDCTIFLQCSPSHKSVPYECEKTHTTKPCRGLARKALLPGYSTSGLALQNYSIAFVSPIWKLVSTYRLTGSHLRCKARLILMLQWVRYLCRPIPSVNVTSGSESTILAEASLQNSSTTFRRGPRSFDVLQRSDACCYTKASFFTQLQSLQSEGVDVLWKDLFAEEGRNQSCKPRWNK